MTSLPEEMQPEPLLNADQDTKTDGGKKPKKDKKRKESGSRGIETMFRTTMSSHLQLSSMADSKANLMISINSIIVSILISSFLKNMNEMPQLLLPTCLLTALCLLTITFALLSTRPRITSHQNTADPAQDRTIDLLFFGDFTRLTADAYRTGVKDVMNNPERLYDTMIDNLYLQGKVLEQKYKLLKISYNLFLFGFPLVVILYIAALWA
ncbi:metal-dependent phosphohydrolase [Spirosoma taeanense]|uniref:Metal-dependent phosphohydrolase n=1 Tax=Spirosoma taeanense TaxID=2735870 RepID=A0A6M5YB79_9BACT|nr:Pycsar system effector family protein [Spirosoma taeanense]QJW90142.1 metal-dependent phosphohydrolase [Spirosoma taeanense]